MAHGFGRPTPSYLRALKTVHPESESLSGTYRKSTFKPVKTLEGYKVRYSISAGAFIHSLDHFGAEMTLS